MEKKNTENKKKILTDKSICLDSWNKIGNGCIIINFALFTKSCDSRLYLVKRTLYIYIYLYIYTHMYNIKHTRIYNIVYIQIYFSEMFLLELINHK